MSTIKTKKKEEKLINVIAFLEKSENLVYFRSINQRASFSFLCSDVENNLVF